VNKTNATIVMAASRGDGYILQPTRTITPIDRTYASSGDLNSAETSFLSHLYIKTIILPRQARDNIGKHLFAMPFCT